MKLRVLFIQRKESYAGQYAPEALCCEDEFTREENPDWFRDEVDKQVKAVGDDIAGHTIVEFDVPQEVIRTLCLKTDESIDATMVSSSKEV